MKHTRLCLLLLATLTWSGCILVERTPRDPLTTDGVVHLTKAGTPFRTVHGSTTATPGGTARTESSSIPD